MRGMRAKNKHSLKLDHTIEERIHAIHRSRFIRVTRSKCRELAGFVAEGRNQSILKISDRSSERVLESRNRQAIHANAQVE